METYFEVTNSETAGLHRDEDTGKASRRPLSDGQGTFERIGKLEASDSRFSTKAKDAFERAVKGCVGYAVTSRRRDCKGLGAKSVQGEANGAVGRSGRFDGGSFQQITRVAPEVCSPCEALALRYQHVTKLGHVHSGRKRQRTILASTRLVGVQAAD